MRRKEVIALIPQLADLVATRPDGFRFGCDGLDTEDIQIRGIRDGTPFEITSGNVHNCAAHGSELSFRTLRLLH
jgi:hypothetical protein